jgi:flagellar basal body-associated protein FliL
MKTKEMMLWGKVVVTSLAVMALSACIEIKSDTKVSSEAKVAFSTTYDMTKVLPTLQQMSKDGGDIAKSLSCDKMNEKLTKELKCKDVSPGKFIVSGEFMGDAGNGVVLDKDKNQVSVDAVQLFKTVADLNPTKNDAAATDPASMMLQKGLVPVAVDQAATYKQMGMALSMNLTLPAEVLTIDGVAAKDIKDNTVSVNFIDIAGKDTYVITSKVSKSRLLWKILFILLAIGLIAAAVLYLMKRNKSSHNTPPTSPIVAPVAAESATDVDSTSFKETVEKVVEVKDDVVDSIEKKTSDVIETVKEEASDVAESIKEVTSDAVGDVKVAAEGGIKKIDDVIEGDEPTSHTPKA